MRSEKDSETRSPDESDEDFELHELEELGWFAHAERVAATGFFTIMGRLPAMFAKAFGLAWRAAPWLTGTALGLNLLAGVATTTSLLAVYDIAETLFRAEPTVERIRAAVPGLILLGSVLTIRAGLGIVSGWAQARLQPLVNRQAEAEFFELTTQVPLAAYDDADFADEMERSNDRGMEAGAQLVTDAVDVLTGVVGVLAVAAAVAVVQPLLLVFLVLAVTPIGWAAVRAARIRYRSLRARITRRRRLWMIKRLMSDRRSAEEIRSNQIGPWLRRRYQAMASAELSAEFDVARKETLTRVWGSLAGGAATAGMYTALLALLAADMIPLAAAAGTVYALGQASGSMRTTVQAVNHSYDDGLYFADHLEFLERARRRLDRPSPGPAAPWPAPEVIELREVRFRYPGADAEALKGVSCTIKAGQTVALVGVNGSGKTTLAKLLAGLYRPSGGVLAWDGVDTAAAELDALREHVAVISQDFQSWPFTARANISLSRPGPSEADAVEAAARAAEAHDLVSGLKFGYDTLLDRQFKDGADLSRGQWQRLAAARGVYRDAPVLICDEPSAALDAKAEAAIFDHLRERTGTTILITHRLANIRHADVILVLDDGHLAASGTHEELVEAGGLYSELFQLQAAGYAASSEQ